jgi:hypothetical protein
MFNKSQAQEVTLYSDINFSGNCKQSFGTGEKSSLDNSDVNT